MGNQCCATNLQEDDSNLNFVKAQDLKNIMPKQELEEPYEQSNRLMNSEKQNKMNHKELKQSTIKSSFQRQSRSQSVQIVNLKIFINDEDFETTKRVDLRHQGLRIDDKMRASIKQMSNEKVHQKIQLLNQSLNSKAQFYRLCLNEKYDKEFDANNDFIETPYATIDSAEIESQNTQYKKRNPDISAISEISPIQIQKYVGTTQNDEDSQIISLDEYFKIKGHLRNNLKIEIPSQPESVLYDSNQYQANSSLHQSNNNLRSSQSKLGYSTRVIIIDDFNSQESRFEQNLDVLTESSQQDIIFRQYRDSRRSSSYGTEVRVISNSYMGSNTYTETSIKKIEQSSQSEFSDKRMQQNKMGLVIDLSQAQSLSSHFSKKSNRSQSPAPINNRKSNARMGQISDTKNLNLNFKSQKYIVIQEEDKDEQNDLTPVKLDKKINTMRVSVNFEDLKKVLNEGSGSLSSLNSGVNFLIGKDIYDLSSKRIGNSKQKLNVHKKQQIFKSQNDSDVKDGDSYDRNNFNVMSRKRTGQPNQNPNGRQFSAKKHHQGDRDKTFDDQYD
ncbi:UNKNOWN [Stylonychia lemnae]|uniref:Uncharacterized protein n=1 Tax=Stylonychia lemnae TaxID=5949 RepID=A0A078AN90_STYLE|nr:UNKNOWN [Stylonychia lemnae]|eukprot:CDW82393.1 UNKNOWN [Stylonychia lemnae]